jgi:ATP-dependent Clp protease adaptor protein ClpS
MPDEKDDKLEGELGPDSGTQTLVRPATKTESPPFYKVVMLNDDFTPREFVVHVLQKFFRKNEVDATQVMLQIHHKGMGVAGVYSYEIAETKAYQCNDYARQNHYPLKCTVEKA